MVQICIEVVVDLEIFCDLVWICDVMLSDYLVDGCMVCVLGVEVFVLLYWLRNSEVIRVIRIMYVGNRIDCVILVVNLLVICGGSEFLLMFVGVLDSFGRFVLSCDCMNVVMEVELMMDLIVCVVLQMFVFVFV